MRGAALFFGVLSLAVSACAAQGGLAWVDGVNEPDAHERKATEVAPLTTTQLSTNPEEAGFPPLPQGSECEGPACDEGAVMVRDYGSGSPRAGAR